MTTNEEIEKLNRVNAQKNVRIRELRKGLRDIVEGEKGDISNGAAIVLMRDIADKTLIADAIASRIGTCTEQQRERNKQDAKAESIKTESELMPGGAF